MSFEMEKKESLRLLSGLENGTMTAADSSNLAEQRDPVMVHMVLRYLREKYPGSDPASAGVAKRLIELTGTYDKIMKIAKKGEKDAVTEWFMETYSLKEFFNTPEQLVDLLVEKIEG